MADSDNPNCHSHVKIGEVEPKVTGVEGDTEVSQDRAGSEDEVLTMYSIRIETYRLPPEPVSPTPPTHDAFFEALLKHMQNQVVLPCFIYSELFYPASDYSWRIPLLAKPPTIEEFKSELGEVSLSGLTLAFEDSPSGLNRASLDTSPGGNEYAVGLSFSLSLKVEEITLAYERTMDEIKRYAAFFIKKEAGS